jgi:hypothetical protein
MSIEAMKQALEVLEQINQLSIGENAISLPGEIDAAMDALDAAIEQAAEPVAWMYDFLDSGNRDNVIRNWVTQSQDDIKRENGFNVRPLYTAPRQWVGLTTQEILEIVDEHTEIRGSLPMLYRDQAVDLSRDIEAKLKDKNAY